MSVTHYIPQDENTASANPILVLVDARGECFEFLNALSPEKRKNVSPFLVDTLNFDEAEENKFEDGIIKLLQESFKSNGYYNRRRIAIMHDVVGYNDPTQDTYKKGVKTCARIGSILQSHGFDIIGTQVPNETCSLTFKNLVEEYLKI